MFIPHVDFLIIFLFVTCSSYFVNRGSLLYSIEINTMKLLFCFLLFFVDSFLSTGNADDVPINHIQVIGSHNSYKQAIDPRLFQFLQKSDSAGMSTIDYSHITLTEQLNLGLTAYVLSMIKRIISIARG